MKKLKDTIEDFYPKLQRDLRILGFDLGCEELAGSRKNGHLKRRSEHRRMLNKLYRLTKVT